MSGRRLLDIAAIYRASRDVAAKHGALRKGQLDVYSRLSSFPRAVRSQTSRITETFKAASALSQRLSETNAHVPAEASSSTYSGQAKTEAAPPADKTPIPQQSVNDVSGEATESKDLGSSDDLASDRARKLQRQAEAQIPSKTAEPPSGSPNEPSETGDEALCVDQEQDVFYDRPNANGQTLSALPRVGLPKTSTNEQGESEKLSNKHLNPDVFYSSNTSKARDESLTDEQLSEKTYAGLFQSHKVADLMRGGANSHRSSNGMLNSTDTMPLKDQSKPPLQEPVAKPVSATNKDIDQLAGDIARDTDHASGLNADVGFSMMKILGLELMN